MQNNYDDIIELPHHRSDRRPHMSMHDRAAQFSPFAALTGHDAAVRETERITEELRDRDEGMKELLDRKLRFLREKADLAPEVEVQYFIPDAHKSGGRYEVARGIFRRVDTQARRLVLEEPEGCEPGLNTAGRRIEGIPLEHIIEITSSIFQEG